MEQMLDELVRCRKGGESSDDRGGRQNKGGGGCGGCRAGQAFPPVRKPPLPGASCEGERSEALDPARPLAFKAAAAVIGGRVKSLARLLALEEFATVQLQLVKEIIKEFEGDPMLADIAKQQEAERFQEELARARQEEEIDDRRDDPVWVEARFNELMRRGTSALFMSEKELGLWKWIFDPCSVEDRRYFAYRFMYDIYDTLRNDCAGATVNGAGQLQHVADYIYGEQSYTIRHMSEMVKAGAKIPRPLGRKTHFPRHAEAVLFRFVAKLRSMKLPVYKSTVLDYAMRLLTNTVYAAYFAVIKDDGSDELIYEWNMCKLDHWFYRRFLGDRPGATTGKQRILDFPRAKWNNYSAMKPYFTTYVQELVNQGIAYYNEEDYDEDDVDEDGVPKRPIAYWVDGERWRAVSFDETHIDDKTHGDGGNRAGRTERITRVSKQDDGTTVGNKTGSNSLSMMGGSNALGEPIPCFVSLACTNFDSEWLTLGPVATVNGEDFGTQGMSTPKGSIDGAGAICFITDTLIPMFDAYGKLSSDYRAVLTCDCVGTHMTTEFLDFCDKHHMTVCLRTPHCSHAIQFEDLVNFGAFKNCKDIGWYKIKQMNIWKQKSSTGKMSVNLSHAKMLKLMVPCWKMAFSQEMNERAWREGGFGKEGITMAPLWQQKKKEQGAIVGSRARSAAERARHAAAVLKLGETFEFDRWLTNPYGQSELERELDEDAEGEGENEDGIHTTRLPVAMLQKMQCPANSVPARKVRDFHDGIIALRSYLKPELMVLMDKHVPNVKWKKVNDARAYLSHFMESEANKLKLSHHKRPVNVNFDCYPLLNKDTREAYEELFLGGKRKADEDAEGATTGTKKAKADKKEKKKPMPFGHGIFNAD